MNFAEAAEIFGVKSADVSTAEKLKERYAALLKSDICAGADAAAGTRKINEAWEVLRKLPAARLKSRSDALHSGVLWPEARREYAEARRVERLRRRREAIRAEQARREEREQRKREAARTARELQSIMAEQERNRICWRGAFGLFTLFLAILAAWLRRR